MGCVAIKYRKAEYAEQMRSTIKPIAITFAPMSAMMGNYSANDGHHHEGRAFSV